VEPAKSADNSFCFSGPFIRSIELIRAGVPGRIGEIHIRHPRHGWPGGVDGPAGADEIPGGLDWDFWIGSSPARRTCAVLWAVLARDGKKLTRHALESSPVRGRYGRLADGAALAGLQTTRKPTLNTFCHAG